MGRLGKCSLSKNPHIIKIRGYWAVKASSAPVHLGHSPIYRGFLEAFIHQLICLFIRSLGCFFFILVHFKDLS